MIRFPPGWTCGDYAHRDRRLQDLRQLHARLASIHGRGGTERLRQVESVRRDQVRLAPGADRHSGGDAGVARPAGRAVPTHGCDALRPHGVRRGSPARTPGHGSVRQVVRVADAAHPVRARDRDSCRGGPASGGGLRSPRTLSADTAERRTWLDGLEQRIRQVRPTVEAVHRDAFRVERGVARHRDPPGRSRQEGSAAGAVGQGSVSHGAVHGDDRGVSTLVCSAHAAVVDAVSANRSAGFQTCDRPAGAAATASRRLQPRHRARQADRGDENREEAGRSSVGRCGGSRTVPFDSWPW